jgi:hypothetical protein
MIYDMILLLSLLLVASLLLLLLLEPALCPSPPLASRNKNLLMWSCQLLVLLVYWQRLFADAPMYHWN